MRSGPHVQRLVKRKSRRSAMRPSSIKRKSRRLGNRSPPQRKKSLRRYRATSELDFEGYILTEELFLKEEHREKVNTMKDLIALHLIGILQRLNYDREIHDFNYELINWVRERFMDMGANNLKKTDPFLDLFKTSFGSHSHRIAILQYMIQLRNGIFLYWKPVPPELYKAAEDMITGILIQDYS